MRITGAVGSLLVFLLVCAFQGLADGSSSDAAKASPELVGQLTNALSITPAQASGGAGALFGLAKSRLSPADFGKVSATVPGMDALIKSAPTSSSLSGLSGVSGVGNLGGLASVAGSFKKLGLSPEMTAKFVPVLTKFVESKGGSGVASILAGALK
jgi:hypothetical protein